jgi:hypothetical protein
MRSLLFIPAMIVCCLSCKKENINAGKTVEIYLLKTYQRVPVKCQVDASASVLQDTATIKDQDILAYSRTKYLFTLTGPAIQKIKTLADATPFAVTVDKQVIYYGFFKPYISSSSCDHSITMDVDLTGDNKVLLRLGYPGLVEGVPVDDQRNNEKLLITLQSQGKLK